MAGRRALIVFRHFTPAGVLGSRLLDCGKHTDLRVSWISRNADCVTARSETGRAEKRHYAPRVDAYTGFQ